MVLSVKAHPGLWATADPLQLPNGLGVSFVCISADCILKIIMDKVPQYISVGRKKKVIEIFETLSPVLLSI